ncbi:MAG: thiamine-phosphate kinase [Acidobacteria bacterium]|nr:thiamine-phosphate kinase [Acidobacteriota bacterium]
MMRSEFEFIQHIKKKYALKHIGDDCAVLPKDDKTDMVITADLLVEDIDFRLDWTTAKFLGHKALAVSLSDIAAMGATPKWAMLSIGVPEKLWNSDFLDEFYEGWHDLAKEFGVELIGGDISRVLDKIVIDSVLSGEVPKGKAILRSVAKPGDAIYVSGELGGAAAGLELLKNGLRNSEKLNSAELKLIRAQLAPTPKKGFVFQTFGVAAMIDLSDGLSSDLAHICSASGIGAKIFSETLPINSNFGSLDLSSEKKLDLVLNGGEDFELLFTVDEKKISPEFLTEFHRIGEATANVGIIELINAGETVVLEPKGYRHF